ncbi:hypothetical protein XU18_0281 [Perkinsela sp. CCAP 1560/4]|nr:hypothetical protein XU18_0281 [Perkinsela sp. CCAP 1560/4]|eukprot:KNH09596.1 hypothetical protein XU18_0281 [Perkinsela sp. CCAP 1560/4]
MKKILVFGASGFVGSHIVQAFKEIPLTKSTESQRIDSPWTVTRENVTLLGVSRDADQLKKKISKLTNPYAEALRGIDWETCDVMNRDDLAKLFERHPDATAVISCIGGFGKSEEAMRKANGPPNINIVHAVYENESIRKLVYISAAKMVYKNINRLIRGYYSGKLSVEDAMLLNLGERGTIIEPGFMYGQRQVGNVELPLGLVGAPLACLTKPLYKLLGWRLFTPPIEARMVAKCALLGCLSTQTPDKRIVTDFQGKIDYDKMRLLIDKYGS